MRQKSWTKPRHFLISRRLCENPWCRVPVPTKESRFCSDQCSRKLMTILELVQAIELEVNQNWTELEDLIDIVSKRARDKWLKNFPLALKVKWNVRDANSESHT